jgi:hypothetical protein
MAPSIIIGTASLRVKVGARSQERTLLHGHPQGSAPTFTRKDGDPYYITS